MPDTYALLMFCWSRYLITIGMLGTSNLDERSALTLRYTAKGQKEHVQSAHKSLLLGGPLICRSGVVAVRIAAEEPLENHGEGQRRARGGNED